MSIKFGDSAKNSYKVILVNFKLGDLYGIDYAIILI